MAKKAAGNKSQAIREALAANPDKSPKEISDLLVAQGYRVNAQYVSTIKSNAKHKVKVRNFAAMRRSTRPTPVAITNHPIEAALGLIKAAGGLEQAQELLRQVAAIRDVL